MQDSDVKPRRGCVLSFGQIVCLVAIGVGLLMLVVAAYQRANPVVDPAMVGKWQATAPYPSSNQVLVIFLDPDGSGRFGTQRAFQAKGAVHKVHWGMVGGRLNIWSDERADNLPITHSAHIGEDEFATDDSVWYQRVH
jgi:hypothetical protein